MYYHVYNRGVEKRNIFPDRRAYERFLATIFYYQQAKPRVRLSDALERPEIFMSELKEPLLVKLVSFSLMPNHYHLLIHELVEGGMSTYIKWVQDSYSKYFNTRFNRVGPLYQGRFKRILVETDGYFLQLVRYIHLNAFMARLVDDPLAYEWDSAKYYLSEKLRTQLDTEIVDALLSRSQFQSFHENYADYARSLHDIKQLVLEEV